MPCLAAVACSWELEQNGKVGRRPRHRAAAFWLYTFSSTSKASLHFCLNRAPDLKLGNPHRNLALSHQPGHLACPGAVVVLSRAELWENLSGLQPGSGALGIIWPGRTGLLLLCFAVDYQWAGGHGNSWAGGRMFFPGNLIIHAEYLFF